MRRVREILRCRAEGGLGYKAIGQRVDAAASTVRDCLARAAAAGLAWPLPATLTDAMLEERLYGAAGTKTGHRRCPKPDWAAVHREFARKHVTLQMLWDEYIAAHPDGYRYRVGSPGRSNFKLSAKKPFEAPTR
jgi:transposase